MTTEDGGFTLNGEPFESGNSVSAETGSAYVLTLADGQWIAVYQPMEIVIPLGATEETVTVTRAEDGTYWFGEMAVKSGETTATASNGNQYTLAISTDEPGKVTWTATYIEPLATIALGLSSDTVAIAKAEDGTYRLGDMAVISGVTSAKAANGNEYTLVLGEDGQWTATYVVPIQAVVLGSSGDSVMIKLFEDRSYRTTRGPWKTGTQSRPPTAACTRW